jgi:hypothetical protein
MIRRRRHFHRNAAYLLTLAAGGWVLLGSGLAPAQESRPIADAPAAVEAPTAPAPANQSGFIDAVGRWFEERAAKLKTDMQSTQEKLNKLGTQAREATKEATGAVVGLPNSRIVTARELCTRAPNGAPDCQTAAATLCRGKGFASGKSLDTVSEQKCNSGRFLLEGRSPSGSECPTEMFVTRAMCQ